MLHQGVWYPHPENPNLYCRFNGSDWEIQAGPEAPEAEEGAPLDPKLAQKMIETKVQYYRDKELKQDTSRMEVPAAEAEAEIIYPNPDGIIAATRKNFKRDFIGNIIFGGILSSFGAFSVLLCLLMLVAGAGPSSLVMLLIGGILLKFGLPMLTRSIKRKKAAGKETEEAFLCTPSEAQALPDGTLCTVTGEVKRPPGVAGQTVLGRDDWVLVMSYSGLDSEINPSKDSLQAAQGGPFYLAEERDRVWVSSPHMLDFSRVGEYTEINRLADAWIVLEGDQVAITGRIATTPEGEREIQGAGSAINFPAAAYSPEEARIARLSQAVSARPDKRGQAVSMGPAVAIVTNGILAPGS